MSRAVTDLSETEAGLEHAHMPPRDLGYFAEPRQMPAVHFDFRVPPVADPADAAGLRRQRAEEARARVLSMLPRRGMPAERAAIATARADGVKEGAELQKARSKGDTLYFAAWAFAAGMVAMWCIERLPSLLWVRVS